MSTTAVSHSSLRGPTLSGNCHYHCCQRHCDHHNCVYHSVILIMFIAIFSFSFCWGVMYNCCIFILLFSYMPLLSLFFVCFLLNVFNFFFFFFFKSPFPCQLQWNILYACANICTKSKNTNEVVENLTNTVSLQAQNVGTKGQPDSRVA